MLTTPVQAAPVTRALIGACPAQVGPDQSFAWPYGIPAEGVDQSYIMFTGLPAEGADLSLWLYAWPFDGADQSGFLTIVPAEGADV